MKLSASTHLNLHLVQLLHSGNKLIQICKHIIQADLGGWKEYLFIILIQYQ